MKKRTIRALEILGILVAFSLIVAASVAEKKNAVVNNYKGVSMSAEAGSISAEGLTLNITNDTKESFVLKDEYILEKKTQGQWYKLPSQTIAGDWEEEDVVIEPETTMDEVCTVTWLESYGRLPSGEYRLLKKFETKDNEEHVLAVTFSL